MEYIYGTSTRNGVLCENLKTVGSEHSYLSGYISTVKEFESGTKITDKCQIVKKYASKKVDDVCYDWYIISDHYRETDTSQNFQKKLDQISANLDYLSMMSGVDIPKEGGAENG